MSIRGITALAAAAAVFSVGAAQASDTVTREGGVTRVKAPTTRVAVRESDGATRVRVRATDSKVDVDTERRHVRIRVPGYSGDIRW
jgi:hypothetical protein